MIADKILAACAAAWLWLAVVVHPLAPWACSVLLTFGAIWAVRTWCPGAWQWLAGKGPVGRAASKCFQALPSVLLGAIIVGLVSGGDLRKTVVGAVTALAAPLFHEVLKWATSKLPGPTYLGGSYPAAGKALLKTRGGRGWLPPISLVLLAFVLLGCTGSLNRAQHQGIAERRGLSTDAVGLAPSGRCESLDQQRRDWSAVAASGLFLAGASGVSAIPAEHLPERYQGPARYGAATTAVLAAALATYAQVEADGLAEAWARECLP